MQGEGRVAWQQGMFLRPEHFQQQDRHANGALQARVGPLRPHPWGLLELSINLALAKRGKIVIDRCRGVFDDGEIFEMPDYHPCPAPIEARQESRGHTLYLTLPFHQAGEPEFEEEKNNVPSSKRYIVESSPAIDAFPDKDAPPFARPQSTIKVARPNFRLLLAEKPPVDRLSLGLARIGRFEGVEIVWDEKFVPPVLDVAGSSLLKSYLSDVLGGVLQAANALRRIAVASGQGGRETVDPFIRLVAMNRWAPVLTHLLHLPNVHPERLFETFLSMSGELSSWLETDAPPKLPLYDHRKLHECFGELHAILSELLSNMPRMPATQLSLKTRDRGAFMALISEGDRELYVNGDFYLVVHSSSNAAEVRSRLPELTTIAALDNIMDYVKDNLSNTVPLRHVVTLPWSLRPPEDAVCFQLDTTASEWREIQRSTALCINIRGKWPGLDLELWCVRRTVQ